MAGIWEGVKFCPLKVVANLGADKIIPQAEQICDAQCLWRIGEECAVVLAGRMALKLQEPGN